MEMESVYWLALTVVLIIIELATMGLTTIWFAGGAAAAFAVSLAGGGLMVQIAVFLVVSIILLVFTRPFAAKYINKGHVKTNVDSLIGQTAVVTEDIDNLGASGEARVGGKIWMARTEKDGEHIPAGTIVTIQSVSGVKLIVANQSKTPMPGNGVSSL